MRDPLPRNGGYQKNFGSNYQGSNGNAATQHRGNNSFGGKKKSDYCWNFNKGIPCKFGSKCKFIERCKYCDSPSHGVNNCQKLQKKSEGNAARSVQETSNNK